MKIPIRVATTLNVDLDDKEAIRIAISVLQSLYEIPVHSHLFNDSIYFNADVGLYGHTSIFVRIASEEDKHALAVIDKLRRVG